MIQATDGTAIEQAPGALAQEAARVRKSGAFGRSRRLLRLFDFLVEESLAGRSPKEAELQHHLFDEAGQVDRLIDASVRVYAHRLRRKLDDFYAGTDSERLTLPRGEYRLVLSPSQEAVAASTPDEPAGRVSWFASTWMISRRVAALLVAAIIVLNLLIWTIIVRAGPEAPAAGAASAPFWQALAEGERMTFVVTGDYYIFGEADRQVGVTRLVREFSVNSRADLDQFLMTHPELVGRYVDLDLRYLPVSIGPALRALLPIVEQTEPKPRSFIISGSQLNPDILKGSNILYVGFLSGLGALRDPLFAASSLTVGESYDELIDRRTGKHYASDAVGRIDDRRPRRDYAYLASIPGPSGNRILIVAGTRDAAVMQAAEVAADAAQLADLERRTGGGKNMEALFEVRTLGNLNLGSSLVFARPLQTSRMWHSDGESVNFPDQEPARDRPRG